MKWADKMCVIPFLSTPFLQTASARTWQLIVIIDWNNDEKVLCPGGVLCYLSGVVFINHFIHAHITVWNCVKE